MTSLGIESAFGVGQSGQAQGIHNPGHRRLVNDIWVDVAGASASRPFEAEVIPAKGVKTAGAASDVMSPEVLAIALQMQTAPAAQASQSATEEPSIENTPFRGVTVPKTLTLHHIAMPRSVEGLGFIPGDVFLSGGISGHYQREITRLGELAKAEEQLSQEYGQKVKLAFDPIANEHIMLRPGDPSYDRVTGVRDTLANDVSQFMLGVNTDELRGLLGQYGFELDATGQRARRRNTNA